MPIFQHGELVYRCPPLEEVREYCREQVDTLWEEIKRFDNPQSYYVDLSPKLWDVKYSLLCMLLQSTVLQKCGGRVAWAWFFAVSILSLLLSPEKEGTAVFLFLGYYPMIKPWLDRRKGSLLWKLQFFNAVIFVLYGLMISVIGAAEIVSSFAEMGKWMAAAAAGMGNLTFFLVDILLSRMKGMLQ